MENRLFIIISAAVAILSSFAMAKPECWCPLVHTAEISGDGWFGYTFAVVAIVLACLNDVKSSLPKGFAIGAIVAELSQLS